MDFMRRGCLSDSLRVNNARPGVARYFLEARAHFARRLARAAARGKAQAAAPAGNRPPDIRRTNILRRPWLLASVAITCAITACGGGGGQAIRRHRHPRTAPTFTTTTFNVNEDTNLVGTVTATDAQDRGITSAPQVCS
jgi:hypothetical protein